MSLLRIAKERQSMVYIFNSGFRPEYVTNVLNTMYVPTGTVLEYRYREEFVREELRRELWTPLRPRDVLIVYVDRASSQGYTYHPIRKGKLVQIEQSDGLYFFWVKMCEYVYLEDISTFQLMLPQALNEDQPRPHSQNPHGPAMGMFAAIGGNILRTDDMYHGHDLWKKQVERLANTHDLSTSHGSALFIRAEMTRHNRRQKQLIPSARYQRSRFLVRPGRRYRLKVSYYDVPQVTGGHNQESILVKLGKGAEEEERRIPISAAKNMVTIVYRIKQYPEVSSGSISIDSDSDRLLPKKELLYEVGRPFMLTCVIVLAVAFYVIAVGFSGVDYSTVPKLPDGAFTWASLHESAANAFSYILSIVGKVEFWQKCAPQLMQVILLVSVFSLFGKKVL